jgi:hypothetical protein
LSKLKGFIRHADTDSVVHLTALVLFIVPAIVCIVYIYLQNKQTYFVFQNRIVLLPIKKQIPDSHDSIDSGAALTTFRKLSKLKGSVLFPAFL